MAPKCLLRLNQLFSPPAKLLLPLRIHAFPLWLYSKDRQQGLIRPMQIQAKHLLPMPDQLRCQLPLQLPVQRQLKMPKLHILPNHALKRLVLFLNLLWKIGDISFFLINSSKSESVPLSPFNSFTSFRENSNLDGVLNAQRIAGICDSIASFESLHSKNPYAFPIFSMILYGSFLYKPFYLLLLVGYNITERFINPFFLHT